MGVTWSTWEILISAYIILRPTKRQAGDLISVFKFIDKGKAGKVLWLLLRRSTAVWTARPRALQLPVRVNFYIVLVILYFPPPQSPGSTVGQTTLENSITLIAECLNRAHKATHSVVTVIENMVKAGFLSLYSMFWWPRFVPGWRWKYYWLYLRRPCGYHSSGRRQESSGGLYWHLWVSLISYTTVW